MADTSSIRLEQRKCPTDGPVGGVIMILGALFLAATLFATFLASFLLLPIRALLQPTSNQFSYQVPINGSMGSLNSSMAVNPSLDPYTLLIDFLILLIVAYCVLVFLTGLGIYRGKPKAFSLAIVLFALLTLVGSGWSILSIGVVAYSVLRKLNVITGPAA